MEIENPVFKQYHVILLSICIWLPKIPRVQQLSWSKPERPGHNPIRTRVRLGYSAFLPECSSRTPVRTGCDWPFLSLLGLCYITNAGFCILQMLYCRLVYSHFNVKDSCTWMRNCTRYLSYICCRWSLGSVWKKLQVEKFSTNYS